jgi:hypothetical protein
MEMVVAEAAFRHSIKRGSRYRTAEGARRAEAGVIGHNEQHVRRALGRRDCLWKVGLGFIDFTADDAAEWRIGNRQYRALDRQRVGGRLRYYDIANGQSRAKYKDDEFTIHNFAPHKS